MIRMLKTRGTTEAGGRVKPLEAGRVGMLVLVLHLSEATFWAS